MMRNRRYRRMQYHGASEMPLAPLIDTAFALLIIFMMSAPLIHHAIKVALPKGSAQEAKGEPEECIICITAQGEYFLRDKAVQLSQLVQELQKEREHQSYRTVFVKADQSVSYGTVLELVDHIKTIESIEYVALSTQSRSPSV